MFGEKVVLVVDGKDYECVLFHGDFISGECTKPLVSTQGDCRELVLGKLATGIRQALSENK